MIGNSTAQTRLCPYCANSISEDAADCSYCKANLSSESVPPWLNRDDPSSEPRTSPDTHKKTAIPAKFIWMGAILMVALIGFFAGGYMQRSEQSLSSQANLKQLQAKEQIIKTQETQLAQMRQQLNENSNQLGEMKTKLEESRKELSVAQQRLAVAARQADRQNASRSPVVRRTAARAPDPAAPLPQRASARRTAAPGVYETTRPTPVHEDPSSSSRVITQIDRGTRINVVSSAGDWLEVRSKRGNPPGYVRSDDARQIGGVN
jgi:hypothetical protein